MPKLELLEDEIGRKLAEAEASGELRAATGFGKPFESDAGWEQTPDELRMPFKILKDAGVVPHEVEMLKQRSQLRDSLAATSDAAQREKLLVQLAALEQSFALRLESLARRS